MTVTVQDPGMVEGLGDIKGKVKVAEMALISKRDAIMPTLTLVKIG